MSEVVVAVFSASILLPGEKMAVLQWIGAAAILAAGLVEVLFGYSSFKKSKADRLAADYNNSAWHFTVR